MRALRVQTFGSDPFPEDVPVPEPGQHEVRIRIAAAGLNFADTLIAKGQYQERPEPPLTLGMEAAGIVDKVGAGVTGFSPGDRVAAFGTMGAIAEYGCFPAAACTRIPDTMPFEDAAAFQIACGTSHVALSARAGLQAGETLVVLGAAGGVGLTAVEIGHLMGARVIAVARGKDRLEAARAAGAAVLIDSAAGDLRTRLKELGGVDVVYDPVGGEPFDAALHALRPEGRMLTIGFASGTVPQVPANLLLVKNISVIGFWWGGYVKFRPEALSSSLKTLFGLYGEGRLKPHVSHRLPLGRAAEGLTLLRERAATGKVVIVIAPLDGPQAP